MLNSAVSSVPIRLGFGSGGGGAVHTRTIPPREAPIPQSAPHGQRDSDVSIAGKGKGYAHPHRTPTGRPYPLAGTSPPILFGTAAWCGRFGHITEEAWNMSLADGVLGEVTVAWCANVLHLLLHSRNGIEHHPLISICRSFRCLARSYFEE